jgi:hypothetical protein
MPISFACDCGKQLRVPDEHAGKRARCPECSRVSTIPSADSGADLATVGVSRELSPTAGGAVRRSVAREQRERPAGVPAVNTDELVRKRPIWPFVLAGGAVLLLLVLAGAGAAAWFLVPRTKPQPEPAAEAPPAPKPAPVKKAELPPRANEKAPDIGDLALIPGDAQGFVTMRLAELWQHKSMQESLKQAKEQGQMPFDPVERMREATGLVPTDVERATLVVADAEKEGVWIVGATVRPYDRATVMSKLPDAIEKKYQGKTYHLGKIDKQHDVAVYFVGPRVLVLGPEEGIKRCLDFMKDKQRKGRLDASIQLAATKRMLVAAIAPPEEAVRKVKAKLPNELKGVSVLLDVEVATLSMMVDDSTHINIDATFPNETKAKQGKVALEGLKSLFELLVMPALKKQISDANLPKDKIKEAHDGLDRMTESIAIVQTGRALQVALAVENKPFEGVKMMQPLDVGKKPKGPLGPKR